MIVAPVKVSARMLAAGLLLAGGGLLAAESSEASAKPPPAKELPLKRWYHRQYKVREVSTPLPFRRQTASHPAGLMLVLRLPEPAELYGKVSQKFGGWDELEFTLWFPRDLPRECLLHFFVKDWDSQWLHLSVPLPQPTTTGEHCFRLPIAGEAAAKAWRPGDHFRPWHQLTPNQLIEYGLKFSNPKGKELTWRGRVYLKQVRLRKSSGEKVKHQIRDLRLSPAKPRVGDLLELAFKLTHPYTDPFDRQDVDLQAMMALPDGDTVPLRAFYFEDFLFDPKDESAKMIPYGRPEFRVRFRLTVPGDHSLRVAGTIGGREIELPDIDLRVRDAPKSWQGFLRPAKKDPRLLFFSASGRDFWGQGLNLRSPYDKRYMQVFPFSGWERYNLNMYKRLFAKFEKAGINVVEVWMAPWWLALEWMPDAPGNHGVGYMNQWRAWKLDRLLEWAEQHDIYLLLAINNHGKFSQWMDAEWARNPFNVARGGYLRSPQEYFSDKRAKRDFKKFADYLVARWGHSPRILAWKLFTEIDLTGDKGGWYKHDSVRVWHQEMARYLKNRDPNKHMVTTHWSGNYGVAQGSPGLAKLKELELLTFDAYYGGQKGTRRLLGLLDGTASFQRLMGKPCLITEFGGTWRGDSLTHILRQIPLSLWKSYFCGLPGSPCLWWFPLVEEKNLYADYAGLAAFAKGEGRTGAKVSQRVLPGAMALQLCELRLPANKGAAANVGAKREKTMPQYRSALLLWLFDRNYYFDTNLLHTKPKTHVDLTLNLSPYGLKAGKYLVEFWDCRTPKPIARNQFTVRRSRTATPPKLPLPPFSRQLAIKVKRLKTP